MLPLNDLPEFAHDFSALRDSYLADEALVISAIFAQASLTQEQREQVQAGTAQKHRDYLSDGQCLTVYLNICR